VATPGKDSSSGRRTKAERKEEARLERERIERQMRARKRNRSLGFALVGVALAAIVAIVVITQPFQRDTAATNSKMEKLIADAGPAATEAGCKDVKNVEFYGGVSDTGDPGYQDQQHIANISQMPPLDTYESVPPTSGPHNQTPLTSGVYSDPPPIDESIHSLEHGGTIIWLSPDADQAKVDEIRTLYDRKSEEIGQDRVIVAPYDYGEGAGQLPEGTQMALVAWHRLQLCAEPSAAVAFDFTSQFSYPTQMNRTYAGEAPEPGAVM
jgi:hypothetical protein